MRLRPGLAIDLGTVNTLVHVAGRGLVVEEPSVVAVDRASGKVAGVGHVAEALSGKEPEDIDVVWPLRDGVVADLQASTLMLTAFLHRAHVHRGLRRPLCMMCVPRGATVFERAAMAATVEVRSPHCTVRLIEEPVAAAIGTDLRSGDGRGAFVVDVGGGTTEVAAVAGGRVVRARSLRVGGNAMDEAIIQAVRARFRIYLGRRAAERLKISLGLTGGELGWADEVGVYAPWEGLRTVRIPAEVVADALEHTVGAIVSAVREVLAEMPPDLADDVVRGRIQLAGGGALLLGLAEAIEASTDVETNVVEDPLRCVIRGAARFLEHDSGMRSSTAA